MKLDIGKARSASDLHAIIAGAFNFPEYYGHNWDAFDECIRGVHVPESIEILGFEQLNRDLPREAALLQKCFSDFATETKRQLRFC